MTPAQIKFVDSHATIPTRFKLIGFVLITFIAVVHLLNTGYRDWNSGADTAYVLGLLFLFFARERIQDERVQALNFKAFTVAFCAGWAIVGTIRFFLYLDARPATPPSVSAYDAMFLMLVIAHALFHCWRFQDGRPGRAL
jgi:hypothetical protein